MLYRKTIKIFNFWIHFSRSFGSKNDPNFIITFNLLVHESLFIDFFLSIFTLLFTPLVGITLFILYEQSFFFFLNHFIFYNRSKENITWSFYSQNPKLLLSSISLSQSRQQLINTGVSTSRLCFSLALHICKIKIWRINNHHRHRRTRNKEHRSREVQWGSANKKLQVH